MPLGMLTGSVARGVEESRRRCRTAKRLVVAHINPDATRLGLAFRQDRDGRVVAVQAFGAQDMGFDQRMKRTQRRRAGADLIGQRREAQINALSRIALALPVKRLMLPVLLEEDHGQKAWPGKAAGQNVEGRRRLADLLAGPAGKLLADVLDHFPLPGDDLERLGDIFAELGKFGRAATRASGRCRNDHALARKIRGKRLAHWLAAGMLWNQGHLAAGLCGGHLGRELIFGGRGFKVFQLELHLTQDLALDELASAFGAAAIEFPPHLLDGELEMCNQRLGAGDIGRRPRGCGLGTRSLRLRIDSRGVLSGKKPFEAFQIVR